MISPKVRVLVVTSEWPTAEHPEWAPFIVQQTDFIRQAGAQVEVFPFRGGKNLVRYWIAWFQLRRQFDLDAFDVIHAHFGQSAWVALPSKKPLVITFHGSDLQGYFSQDGGRPLSALVLRLASGIAARLASEVVLVSEHLALYLPPSVGYQVIPGGVNFDLFRQFPRDSTRQKLGLPVEKSLVLFTSNPEDPNKRYALAKIAVEKLKQDLNCELILVQGIPHKEMPLYFSAADALLLTSQYEGSPTVVKEALACNLPVVSLNIGDIKTRLSGIPGCSVCADDSPETIAKDLKNTLHFPREAFTGRNAVADLSADRVAERVMEVYRLAMRHSR